MHAHTLTHTLTHGSLNTGRKCQIRQWETEDTASFQGTSHSHPAHELFIEIRAYTYTCSHIYIRIYGIAGNIGGELYLADWRISCHTTNIKSANIVHTHTHVHTYTYAHTIVHVHTCTRKFTHTHKRIKRTQATSAN